MFRLNKKGLVNPLSLVLFIWIFWLILPFMFMVFGVADIEIPTLDTSVGEPSGVDQIIFIFKMIRVYFQLLTFSFPSINWIVGRIFNIIQLTTFIGGIYILKNN